MDKYLNRVEIHKVEESPEILSYRINHIDPSILNAVRRTIISDVPTVAIHWVFIRENETVMADEILAHRLGLVPVICNPSVIAPVEKSESFDPTVDLTEKNSVFMDLVITNTSNEILPVYSDSITLHTKLDVQVKKNVLITRLAPKKRIECKMFAILGTGRDHSKWMPTSACYYRCIRKLTLKDPARAEELKKYFREGFTLTKDGPKIDEDRLLVNMDILKAHPDAVDIHTENDSFFFEIETISEAPRNILKRGFAVLYSKLEEIEAAANRAVI